MEPGADLAQLEDKEPITPAAEPDARGQRTPAKGRVRNGLTRDQPGS